MLSIVYEKEELTMERLYAGKRLFSTDYGWGSIESISIDAKEAAYPILMNFDSGKMAYYTSQLTLNADFLLPSLFESEPEIKVSSPKVIKIVSGAAALLKDEKGTVYFGSIYPDKASVENRLLALNKSAMLWIEVLHILEFSYPMEVEEVLEEEEKTLESPKG